MKTIVVEHKCRDIFGQIPEITLNKTYSGKPYFGWGNKKELVKHILLLSESNDDVYPLIWLLPSKDNYTDNGLINTKDCVIIIAVRNTNEDQLNSIRWQKSFDLVLDPMSNFVIEGLMTSTVSRITDGEWTIERFTDYSDEEEKGGDNEKENATIDLWDAIRFEASVEFTNECLKTITWQTNQ